MCTSDFQISFVILLVSLLFVSCVASAPKSSSVESSIEKMEKRGSARQSEELNQKIIQQSLNFDTRDYLVGPGDLLSIQVLETKDLNTDARVNPDNDISYPLLGKVEVGGLTSQEIEDKMTQLLKEKYLQDPHVVVSIKEYRSKRVAVIGSVKKPGTYEILGSGNLLYALALAEGLTENAGKVAYVTRRRENGKDDSMAINLDALLEKGDLGLNVPIQMGDVVYVPEAGVFYVDGAVNKPGSYKLTENMTISKAVTTAGGFSNVASDSDVRLIRNVNGKAEITKVDVDEINKGNEKDIALVDQDVVVVGANAIKSFLSRIRPGIFFPPFSVGLQ